MHVHVCAGAHVCTDVHLEAREPCRVFLDQFSPHIWKYFSHLNPKFADGSNLRTPPASGSEMTGKLPHAAPRIYVSAGDPNCVLGY